MMSLWVKRPRKNCWVCSGRLPQPLVADFSFLVKVLRLTSDPTILLIFERSALVWARDKSVVA